MIVNLTQHTATPEQIAAGVVDLVGIYAAYTKAALTFNEPPSAQVICDRAAELARQANAFLYMNAVYNHADRFAMIGGAPYLMRALEEELRSRFITPLYSFTQRESVEKVNADGSVSKVSVFQHVAFVEAV